MEHWLYTTEIAGQSMTFNLDTIFTMWFAQEIFLLCRVSFKLFAKALWDFSGQPWIQ